MPRVIAMFGIQVIVAACCAAALHAEDHPSLARRISIVPPPPRMAAPAAGVVQAQASGPVGAAQSLNESSGVPAPLPLMGPRSRSKLALSPPGVASQRNGAGAPLASAMGSLAVVLGLFFVVAWLLRRSSPKSGLSLPPEVVEVLGKASLPGRQQLHLIRCGNKLLLACRSPAGLEPLMEIDDPAEVDRLAGICREAHPNSSSVAFKQILQQLGGEKYAPGFVDDPSRRRFAQGGDA